MVTPLFSHPERFKEAVIIGIIAAIPEEYLYRGIILGNLLRSTSFIKLRGKRVIITLVISSFIFALAHVSNILTSISNTISSYPGFGLRSNFRRNVYEYRIIVFFNSYSFYDRLFSYHC